MAKRYLIQIYPFPPEQPFGRYHFCQVGVNKKGRYVLYVEQGTLGNKKKHGEHEITQALEQMAERLDVPLSKFASAKFVRRLPFEVTHGDDQLPLRVLDPEKQGHPV